MNKKIIFPLILVIAFATMFYFGQDTTTATLPVDRQVESGTKLIADLQSYDFGTISMKDGVVKKNFLISNNSETDIVVDSLVTSCMCTEAFIVNGEEIRGPFGMPGHGNTVPKANELIKAGEKRTIEVVFDPAAHGPAGVGVAQRFVYLVDKNGGALRLEIKADVTL